VNAVDDRFKLICIHTRWCVVDCHYIQVILGDGIDDNVGTINGTLIAIESSIILGENHNGNVVVS